MPPGSSLATFAHRPEKETNYPCAPDLGRHIITKMMEKEFDVGTSKTLPSDGLEWSRDALPHAFGFMLRQIMKDRPVPHVPIMINTFYPPNQPTAQRCHRFGLALKEAIESFPKDTARRRDRLGRPVALRRRRGPRPEVPGLHAEGRRQGHDHDARAVPAVRHLGIQELDPGRRHHAQRRACRWMSSITSRAIVRRPARATPWGSSVGCERAAAPGPRDAMSERRCRTRQV